MYTMLQVPNDLISRGYWLLSTDGVFYPEKLQFSFSLNE